MRANPQGYGAPLSRRLLYDPSDGRGDERSVVLGHPVSQFRMVTAADIAGRMRPSWWKMWRLTSRSWAAIPTGYPSPTPACRPGERPGVFTLEGLCGRPPHQGNAVDAEEFIRRFLLHVLPKRFV